MPGGFKMLVFLLFVVCCCCDLIAFILWCYFPSKGAARVAKMSTSYFCCFFFSLLLNNVADAQICSFLRNGSDAATRSIGFCYYSWSFVVNFSSVV